MNEIDYIEDRQRNVIKLFHERGELSFNSLIGITGWEEYVLAKILKLLLSKDVIEEYFDELNNKICYRVFENKKDDLLTIKQRLNKFEK